jgi:hypothetical protein
VTDRIRLYLVVRNDASVEVTDQWCWEFGAMTFRVKARVAAACPDPAKAIRKLEIGDTGGDTRGTKTATTPAGRSGSKA